LFIEKNTRKGIISRIMEDRARLGVVQMAIIASLKERDSLSPDLFTDVRKRVYGKDVANSTSRHRIRRAIASLKLRGIIEQHYSILTLKNRNYGTEKNENFESYPGY
jgi:hypothetical protein